MRAQSALRIVPPRSDRDGAEFDIGTRRTVVAGMALIAVTFGGFGGWAALAPLESAAVAQGSIIVEGERKTVQHLEGGIVSELRVKEGDRVREGDVLVRLDATLPRAGYQELLKRLRLLAAQEIRLRAERANARELVFAHPLLDGRNDPEVREVIEAQRQQFDSQRDSMKKNVGVLEQKVMQLTSDIEGYQQQLVALREQNRLYVSEVTDLKPLVDAGYSPRTPLLRLQRDHANVVGAIGDVEAKIVRAKESITENRIQIENVRAERLKNVDAQLAGVQTDYAALSERWQASRDQVNRVDIRAPVSGTVLGLRFHSVGGVIRPGEPVMDIVPDNPRYTIEARVQPQDIDVVRPGLQAQIRFSAYSARRMSDGSGTVTTVSADRIDDPATRISYYKALIALNEQELRRPEMAGLQMYPGMPVDVYINTGRRTPLQAVLVDFENWAGRGFREQ